MNRFSLALLALPSLAHAGDWPEENQGVLMMVCMENLAPEFKYEGSAAGMFCACFVREVTAGVSAQEFESDAVVMDGKTAGDLAMSLAIPVCQQEVLASAISGGPGGEIFKMDEGDKTLLTEACIQQRESEGRAGDNRALCVCTTDYIAKKWTLADMVANMDANLAEADKACVKPAGPSSTSTSTSTVEPTPVIEEDPIYIEEEDDFDLNLHLFVHHASDLPKSGARDFSWGLALSTHTAGRLRSGFQLQREVWVDTEAWRVEMQPEFYLFGKSAKRASFGVSAVGGLGYAPGFGFGASVAGEATLGYSLSSRLHPALIVRAVKPFGYGGDFRLQSSVLQIGVGHRL